VRQPAIAYAAMLACMKKTSDFSLGNVNEIARADAARALAEDVGEGDLTVSLIDPHRR
jgi:nicotinate-nucleotide pyrophosphorylase (carboxylating)